MNHKNPVKGVRFRKFIRPFMRLCLAIQRKMHGFKVELISGYYEKRINKLYLLSRISVSGIMK